MKKYQVTVKTKLTTTRMSIVAKSTCEALRTVSKVFWDDGIYSIQAKPMEG